MTLRIDQLKDLLFSFIYKCFYGSLRIVCPYRYTQDYSFTQDWFTIWIPIWRKIHLPLQGKPNLKALEIGSFEGRSSIWLLENILTEPTSTLVSVDPYFQVDNYLNRFSQNLSLGSFRSKVTHHRDMSSSIFPALPNESFNIIYLDGAHTEAEVYNDCIQAWRCLTHSGFMILDDYLLTPLAPLASRPKNGIDRFLKEHFSNIKILHKGYQIFIQKL